MRRRIRGKDVSKFWWENVRSEEERGLFQQTHASL